MRRLFSFSSIGLNFAVGAVVDFCRSRFATIERPAKGSVIGFCLSQGPAISMKDPTTLLKYICGSLNQVMAAVQLFLLFIQFWWQFKILKLLMPQLFYMQSEKGSVWFGLRVLCFFFLWIILDSSLVLCKWLRYLFCKFGTYYKRFTEFGLFKVSESANVQV